MKKITTIIGTMVFLSMITIHTSEAAMEIKDNTWATEGINLSNAFAYCYNLRASSTTLGKNQLDPHLCTAYDYGAAIYLASSVYGINVVGNGIYDTTKNKTGVLEIGNDTQNHTSHMFVSALLDTDTSKSISGAENLATYFNTKYVTKLPLIPTKENTRGMGYKEIERWGASYSYNIYLYPNEDSPITIRYSNLYGCDTTLNGYPTSVTFRPAIWN